MDIRQLSLEKYLNKKKRSRIWLDIIKEWYNFRDKRYKEIAISWCKQNELEYM